MPNIIPIDEAVATIQERVRFYISNPDKAGEALTFVKQLKDLAVSVEEKVKERSWDVMQSAGLKQLDHGGYVATLHEPTEVTEYNPQSVLDALGIDGLLACSKISTPKVKTYLSKYKIEGENLGKLHKNEKVTTKAGYISVKEKETK